MKYSSQAGDLTLGALTHGLFSVLMRELWFASGGRNAERLIPKISRIIWPCNWELRQKSLNRRWFERESGRRLENVQKFLRHPKLDWMGATLDGMVKEETAVFEAKFMLPWSFTEKSAAEKHMPQLQHNMLVAGARRAYLSILTGGGKWVSIEVDADPVYQTVLLQVERIFWRCVKTGEMPRVFGAEPPKAKLPVVRVVDMGASNAWGEHAAIFARTRASPTQSTRRPRRN